MLKLIATLVCLCLAPVVNGAPMGSAVVADRAVAIVGSTVLTASDIRLHHALNALDPSDIPVFNGAQSDAQQHAIQATAIRIMAGKIPVYQPSSKQTTARVNRFREQWKTPDLYREFLQLHGLSEDRLATVLRRRQIVERVVFRALGVPAEERAEWRQRFDAWLQTETKSVLVRLIPERPLMDNAP